LSLPVVGTRFIPVRNMGKSHFCTACLGRDSDELIGEKVKDHTKRRNINRGYMKLEVWQDAMELFKLTSDIMGGAPNVDFRLRSQILDSAQSIASNIAEGYCRRSINEYLYFLNVALGSSGEVITRVIGIKLIGQLREGDFERFDELHYKVENKLLALVKSLQAKRAEVV